MSGADIVYLLRYKSDGYIIGNVVAGSILPASCTAMGKVLLSCLDELELESTLERIDLNGSRRGPNAVKTISELREELSVTRERGWGIQNEEVAHGLRSIAVPVINLDGPAGAIAVSVESSRWSEQKMIDELLPTLQETADKASISMGYLPSVRPSH